MRVGVSASTFANGTVRIQTRVLDLEDRPTHNSGSLAVLSFTQSRLESNLVSGAHLILS